MRGRRILRVIRPFQEFFAREASGGILLMLSTVAALAMANSPLAVHYLAWRDTIVSFSIGGWSIEKDILHIVNDGFMALFFFVVGLEIKRELLVGELSSWQKASVPVFAAIGGMVVPAGIYFAMNRGTPYAIGWGVPTATDIAFALAVLSLLGKRVPLSARVFLAALAIMDDIGAVLLIAIFYSKGIQLDALVWAAGALGVMFVFNFLGVRRILPYFVVGMFLWAFVFVSGLHPTIAGVLGAMSIPATARIDVRGFIERAESLLQAFRDTPGSNQDGTLTEDQQAVVEEIEKTTEGVGTPLQSLMHTLHPWVAFLVVPVFGFFNAGVSLTAGASHASVLSGASLGLFVGKPLGVLALVFLGVKLRVGRLPDGLSWKHVAGLGALAGIGFTMSLFIGELAFRGAPAALDSAKLGVLAGSLASTLLGVVLLLVANARRAKPS